MIESLFELLSRCAENNRKDSAILNYATKLPELNEQATNELFSRLQDFAKANDSSIWPNLFALLFGQVALLRDNAAGGSWPPPANIEDLRLIYRQCPAEHPLRNQLLAVVANVDDERGLKVWSELICDDPPHTAEGIGLAFGPLASGNRALDGEFLTRLILHATDNLYVAAAVYELANHAFRSGKAATHPAANRRGPICELLRSLIDRLAQIENGEIPAGLPTERVAETVSNSVSLIIALTDTVALLKEDRAIGKLNQALQLRHRRIQVEAAAALARMGDENGKRHLIESAQHPVVRQRVIAYAEELGCEREISLELRGPIATAESHLAMWLAQPEHMGLAPTRLQMIDQRKLYWPSYDDPVPCFLFRFEYGTGDSFYENVGISGPLTHAFIADITRLLAEDQYAAFAGWQTVNQEIYVIPFERAVTLVAAETDRLKHLLAEQSLEIETIEVVSSFFGEYGLVATGSRSGETGTWIVDRVTVDWIPHGNHQAPVDWQLALNIWRGRRILATFNPAFSR